MKQSEMEEKLRAELQEVENLLDQATSLEEELCGFSRKRSRISVEIDQRFHPRRSPSERSDAGLFDSAVK